MADEWTKTKVFRIVLRIATVVFSIWSWIKTTNASQTMQDGSTITSSDYPSFQYSSVSELVSAVLQGVAIFLEVVGHKKCSKFVEMLDKVILALMTSSTALLFAVDEITSCGPGRRSVSSQAREFSGGIRQASHLSLAATFSASSAAYTMRAPAALTLAGELLRRLIGPDDGGPNIIHVDDGGGDDDDRRRPDPFNNNDEQGSNNGKDSDNEKPSSNNGKNNGNNSGKLDPKQPSSKKGKKSDNLELLITAPPGPSHYHPNCYYPTGLGFGVSCRCEDEDAEAGCRNDRFH